MKLCVEAEQSLYGDLITISSKLLAKPTSISKQDNELHPSGKISVLKQTCVLSF